MGLGAAQLGWGVLYVQVIHLGVPLLILVHGIWHYPEPETLRRAWRPWNPRPERRSPPDCRSEWEEHILYHNLFRLGGGGRRGKKKQKKQKNKW